MLRQCIATLAFLLLLTAAFVLVGTSDERSAAERTANGSTLEKASGIKCIRQMPQYRPGPAVKC
jgi:hypothetical protein